MFLYLLEDESKKKAFLKLAYLVAISDGMSIKNNNENTDGSYGDVSFLGKSSIGNMVASSLVRGVFAIRKDSFELDIAQEESEMIKNFSREMNIDDFERVFDDFKSALRRAVEAVFTLGVDINSEELKMDLISKMVVNIVDNQDLALSSIQEKIIAFELVGMMHADNKVESAERHVVDCVCDHFMLEPSFIEKASNYISKLTDVYKEILSFVKS